MDPTRIAKWVALPGAVLAAIVVVITQYGSIKDGWAQEAGRVAADTTVAIVKQYTAPLVKTQEQTVDLLRRQEDRALLDRCETRAERRGVDPLEYEAECIRQSNKRWAYWECEDETPEPELLARCGLKPE
jgi:hypothetical protein